MRRFAVLLVAVLGAACAGRAGAPVELDRARLARAKELKADSRAKEPYARAERVRSEASRLASDDPARADRTSEARLWLEAAIADAERIELSAARLSAERELERTERELVELSRELLAASREADRLAAAGIAREEARRALERAALAPKQRPKLSREEAQKAGRALLLRAELVARAVAAFTQDQALLAPVTRAISDAQSAANKDPDLLLDRADRALYLALAALGPLRRDKGAPSEAEARSLRDALEDAGARAVRVDRGLSGVLAEAFTGAQLKTPSARKLARLCALGKAHPHGPVRVLVSASSPAQGAARSEAVARELLREGCEGPRYASEVGPAGDALELTWLSY